MSKDRTQCRTKGTDLALEQRPLSGTGEEERYVCAGTGRLGVVVMAVVESLF